MRALILTDRENWSYMQIAKAIQRHNTDPDLTIDVMSLKGRESEFLSVEKRYQKVLVMGWQMCESRSMRKALDGERWLTGIHSAHAFDQALETTPEKDIEPPKTLIRTLKQFRGVNCVSQRLFDQFSGKGLNLHLTPNGVDTDLFKPTAPFSTDGPLRVGFAGTAKGIHDRRKGLRQFAIPACEKAGVELVTAVARTETALPPSAMPAFHNSYDVFLLPSSSEGISIAALEAAACGRVVVSTRVGGSTELIHHGEDGFLVDRSVDAIAELLRGLRENRKQMQEIGLAIRKKVEKLWSWSVRVPAWLAFLRA